MRALTIWIAGADYPNKRGPTRRYGIALLRPGDPVELRPEPKNPVDPAAIAIYGGDIQLGYVPGEKCQWFGSMTKRGETLVAIFQAATEWGGLVRVGIGGQPDLPVTPEEEERDDSGVYPDPIYDDE